MLLHGKIPSSTANGPGNRAVLWFQGCNLGCVGCHNPGSHPFLAAAAVPLAEVQTWLLNLDGIDGVTFSGGEPIQHFADLLELCQWLRKVRPELSIGMYTGYTQRELETGHWQAMHPLGALVAGSEKLWSLLWPLLDFAVMGRFNASRMTTTKPLCGSNNQDIVLFSDRYAAGDFQAQKTEVFIGADGTVRITGYPGNEFIKAVQTI